MARVESFRDLDIWKQSKTAATRIYELSSQLPATEVYGLASQMRRASVSVPTNIAEGWGRGPTRAQGAFLRVAIGSLCELETLLEIAKDLRMLSVEAVEATITDLGILRKRIGSYASKLETNYVREAPAEYGAVSLTNN